VFLFAIKRPGREVNHWCSFTAEIRVYPLLHLYTLWHGYSDLLRSVWSGYWILVCALDFLHQSKLALVPTQLL
jgi:hypothetical protein